MNEFVMKRKDNYWWERTLVLFEKPLIMFLVSTPITPNMVTSMNLLLVLPLVCVTAWYHKFFILSLLIQVYVFLDIMDGNLARNKNMKSEFGRKLDILSDTFFYTVGYFFIGIGMDEPIWIVVLFILVQRIYGLVATYYIVPNIRKLNHFEHTSIKKYFINKDIIFGMDVSLETLITSVLLFFPIRKIIFIICPILWSIDLVYRLYELKWLNRKNIM